MDFRLRQAFRGHKADSTDRTVGHARLVSTEGHARLHVSICGLSRTASDQNGMSRVECEKNKKAMSGAVVQDVQWAAGGWVSRGLVGGQMGIQAYTRQSLRGWVGRWVCTSASANVHTAHLALTCRTHSCN